MIRMMIAGRKITWNGRFYEMPEEEKKLFGDY